MHSPSRFKAAAAHAAPYAELDLESCVEPKRFHDVVAGYNRFDVFGLSVDRTRHEPVQFREAGRPTEQQDPTAPILRLAVEG